VASEHGWPYADVAVFAPALAVLSAGALVLGFRLDWRRIRAA